MKFQFVYSFAFALATTFLGVSVGSAATLAFEYRTVATYPSSAPRTCFIVDSSMDASVSATSDCTSPNGKVSGMASSGPDGLKASASVSGLSDDGQSSTYGTAYLFDELSFSVDSGIFRIGVDISGSIDLLSDNYADGNASVDLASYDISGVRTPWEVFDHTVAYRSDLGVYIDELVGSYGMNYVDIAFADGYLKLDATLSATTRCILFVSAPNCAASVDFSSTAIFTGGLILDSSGAAVDGATIASASGTDYLGDNSGPPVGPIPATLPLLLAGFGCLAFARRRSK